MKMKNRKVTLLFFDHWTGAVHYVERWLEVGVEHEMERDRFYAYQHDADRVFEEIKTNPVVIERCRLVPTDYGEEPALKVDASLHDILIAHNGSIAQVNLVDRRGGGSA
tara:strand:+ start:1369 stop:1695 length:327 start_codon:yes stop_codon:yes gene_type:complete